MKILLIGTGFMATEFLKVIDYLKLECVIVGRGQERLDILKKEFPNYEFHSGGIEKYLRTFKTIKFNYAINAVNVNQLFETSRILIKSGISNILLEKPGAPSLEELRVLLADCKKYESKLFIAYNRRFFSSINTLKKLTIGDGGIRNVKFDFTEWTHRIDPEDYDSLTLKHWIISNSSHVIDTVFHLIGKPVELNCITSLRDNINWHPSASIFVGSGTTANNIPFTYNSNWTSAGRWSIEVLTDLGKYILSPMEELFFIKKGEISSKEIMLADNYSDLNFKPGILKQMESFISDGTDLCTIEEQLELVDIYYKIGNYKK